MKIPDEIYKREKFQFLLKKIRQKSGVRQIDMAEQLGVSQSFISKYESGERRVDIFELWEICHLLGVSLLDFIQQLEENISETE